MRWFVSFFPFLRWGKEKGRCLGFFYSSRCSRKKLEAGNSKMELNWKLDRTLRPGSATVRVTDLGWQGLLNPSPSVKEDEELLVDEYLSPSKLKALTGLDDLRQVKALEMRVNTRENSLGNFGSYLPNLKHLKLNGSILSSVRDLGTALSHLQVLWMARCGLPDLDGISSCCFLKELYIAYNNISDLSQISLLEHLEILDLEGNNIDDLSQIQYLGLCSKLTILTVEGNMICLKPILQSSEDPDYNYRAEVKKLIPHLKCLDEIPAHQTVIPFPFKLTKDWLIVKESIKEGSLIEEASGSDFHLGLLTRRPGSAVRSSTIPFLLGSRPQNIQRSPSAHLLSGGSTILDSAVCDDILPEDDSSDLTHGVSRVICGNPIKALHARRQKLGSAVTNLFQPLCHPADHTYDFEETSSVNGKDMFTELKVLQEHHYKQLQALQREKSSQVLKMMQSDEGEEDCYSLSDSCDEDSKEAIQEDITQIASSDTSCRPHHSQVSSDSSHSLGNSLPSIVKHPVLPSPPKCPSPGSIQGVTAGLVRARHLKIPNSKKAALLKPSSSVVNKDAIQHIVERAAVLNLQRKQDSSSNSAVLGQRQRTCDSKWIRRPFSGPAAFGTTNSRSSGDICSTPSSIFPYNSLIRAAVDRNLPTTINSHPCTNMSEMFAALNVVRPLTAKAALQSLTKRPDLSLTAQSKTPQL